MKKILLYIILSITVTEVHAQPKTLQDIQNLLLLNQLTSAKKAIDVIMLDGKQEMNPQAQLVKAAVYASLSMDVNYKNKPEGYQVAQEADAAFQKYKAIDPPMKLLLDDGIYWQAFTNLFYSFYLSGYADYDKQAWSEAFAKLKKAVDYSDLLISKKILAVTIDTNMLILAGVTAEKSGNKDDAAGYYKRLADVSIGGESLESVYRYLTVYYFEKKDMPNFDKYKAIGLQLYPKSEYFKYDKVDLAIGLSGSFEEKLKTLENLLLNDPQNKKANDIYWNMLYDALNPEKASDPLPPNATALEQKMIVSINKAYYMNLADETPMIYLGNHFVFKRDIVAEARQKHDSDMKARTSPGSSPSADDVAKQDAWNKQYAEAMEAIRNPYEKAAYGFASKPSLTKRQKEQYRNIAGYLAEIYESKKKNAVAGSPEQKTFEEKEIKWDALYRSHQ